MKYTHPGFSKSVLRLRSEPISVEPVTFGDDRITVGPRRNELTIDYHTSKLSDTPFKLLYSLVEHVDEPVKYGDLVKDVWGWDEVTSRDMTRFKTNIRNSMVLIRQQLGPELGDPCIGAIQTIESLGYVAFKHLQSDD